MGKNIVRLTESQLRKIVKEATIKILSEGKVVNNKPYFDICRINGKPTGKKAKPGQELSMSNTYDWDLGGNARSHGIEKQYFSPEQKAYINAHTGDDGEFYGDFEEFDVLPDSDYTKLWKAIKKHNDRVKNYKNNGHRYPANDDRYVTLWGTKESDEELANDRAEERESKLRELRRKNGQWYGFSPWHKKLTDVK